jgi:ABC-2 type transport system ATP-binding protein
MPPSRRRRRAAWPSTHEKPAICASGNASRLPGLPIVAAVSEAAILTSGLTKHYGEIRGIVDLDLEVRAGEVFGFLGPNGAGKTTTIRLLLDLIRPTGGRASVLGRDVGREGVEVRRRTGYLPGELHLHERHTAASLLAHLGRLRGGVPHGAIEELAERLGLDLGRRVRELSKGNRQKVGVIAALMHDPEVLLLDEPTSGLDPLRQQDVLSLLRERAESGRTVFLSSHALDEVQEIAGRVGIIREGRLVAVEAVAALRARALRRVEVRFERGTVPPDLSAVPGVRDVVATRTGLRLHVEGSMDALIKALAGHPVHTLTSEEPELEQIFLSYYGRSHEG